MWYYVVTMWYYFKVIALKNLEKFQGLRVYNGSTNNIQKALGFWVHIYLLFLKYPLITIAQGTELFFIHR